MKIVLRAKGEGGTIDFLEDDVVIVEGVVLVVFVSLFPEDDDDEDEDDNVASIAEGIPVVHNIGDSTILSEIVDGEDEEVDDVVDGEDGRTRVVGDVIRL